MLVNGKNVSKFIDEDLSSIQKIITENLKDNRSSDVKAVNIPRSQYRDLVRHARLRLIQTIFSASPTGSFAPLLADCLVLRIISNKTSS
jgi:hypothetical protein